MMDRPDNAAVSVVIPTLNAMAYLPALLPALRAQKPSPPKEILIVDSRSTDGTRDFVLQAGGEVRLLDVACFSHGGTRNLGIQNAREPIVVFLSQDAIPRDDTWLARLIAPLQDPQVAAAFSRQVPRPGANPMEQFFLATHFPETPVVYRRRNDGLPPAFQRDVFFSNVSSVVRREVILRHPFDDTLIMSEDQQFARDILLAGHAVVYASGSVVLHSHDYTFLTAFQRYFDSAYSLTQIFKGHGISSSARMGTSYLRRECAMMIRRHPLLLPRYAAYVLAKTLGTVLGHFADRLPRRWARALSLHPAYWTAGSA